MKNYNFYKLLVFTMVISLHTSCKKFIEVPPPSTQLINNKVFEDDGNAEKAVNGIYIQMNTNGNLFSGGSFTYYAGLSADELSFYSNDTKQEFLKNEISPANHDLISVILWNPAYKFIYTANACVEGLMSSSTLTPSIKSRLIGEVKFIRAFCYFYLINTFGDVPLISGTNYEQNAIMSRTSKDIVYRQIIEDLVSAKTLLDNQNLSGNRIRPNKWTAAALLARIYLYQKDWANAVLTSSEIITSGIYHLESDLNSTFIKESSETIFQLPPVQTNINTWEGSVFLPPTEFSTPSYLIKPSLLNAFEPGDLRKIHWVLKREFKDDFYFLPFKYKVQTSMQVSEYYVFMRLAEQYLIRAEARTNLEDLSGAQEDLNMIRNRAGLPNTTANDKSGLAYAIEQERRVELFAEWGHRWLDLIRTGRANKILGDLKPETWQPSDVLWPIPSSQIKLNPALTQNPGY